MWDDPPSNSEFGLVSQLDFGFGRGDGGADDEEVPVTDAVPSEEDALAYFAEQVDVDSVPHEAPSLPTAAARAAPRLTLGAARQLGIGPWGRPAAAAPSGGTER